MSTVYLGLGSNIDAIRNLRAGIAALRARYGELELSAVYRSAPVGFNGDDFLNLVARLQTDASPSDIHESIERIHEQVGRVRGSNRFASRALDIDLLMYDDLVQDGPVKLPRCDVLQYNFVLQPLTEIAAGLVHPQTGQTLQHHLDEGTAGGHPLSRVDVIL